ncbi:MAG: ABC transporter substrate-binding protein [Chloroflexi bacterium]|nr:ABC transporter substrate-binding protein [Chloroflexota bacterium]
MARELNRIIEDFQQRRLGRREFVIKAAALGLSMGAIGSILAACGGGAATPAATETGTTAATTTATAGVTETATAAATETATPTATQASTGGSGSNILRIRIPTDIQILDPAYYVAEEEYVVNQTVFNNLIIYGPNGYEANNDLAEKIETSPDGKTVTFTLKQGVQWHKGYGEVTTDDVKFSYERIGDPANNSPYQGDWATLDHVEVIDKYNGKIILKEPFAPLFKSTLPVGSGQIIPKKYYEEVGKEKFATNILGSGPYIFDSWTPKDKVIVKKNPDYFGDPPKWDEIHFVAIDDDKVGEVALDSGDLDFGRVSPASFSRYQGQTDTFATVKKPRLGFLWIGMNMQHPKLQDINVRQAIRYGIDVPSILQAAYMGQVDQCYGLIAPGLLGYWADAPQYKRDVAKAKDYMSKAGLTSLDLTMDFIDTSEYRPWFEVSQQNLAEIGINLTANTKDSSSFWGMSADQQKQMQLFCSNYSMEPDPSWATVWFISDQIGVWNWMSWSNKEYDDLHKQGLVELDDTKRQQIYVKMQQLWDEACHTVWLTHYAGLYVSTLKIKPAVTPHGLIQSRFFEPA